MELNAEQIKKSISYIENVLSEWTLWQKHHRGLVQSMHEILALVNEQEQKIKELTEENERLRAENEKIIKEAVFSPMERAHNTIATVRTMQELIKERCIKGGIYPAFVERVIDEITKELIGE